MLGREVVSERRAGRVLAQSRSSQRRQRLVRDEEELLVSRMVQLATEYSRYGYRRSTGLLRAAGWPVNHKRLERLWRQGGAQSAAKTA